MVCVAGMIRRFVVLSLIRAGARTVLTLGIISAGRLVATSVCSVVGLSTLSMRVWRVIRTVGVPVQWLVVTILILSCRVLTVILPLSLFELSSSRCMVLLASGALKALTGTVVPLAWGGL